MEENFTLFVQNKLINFIESSSKSTFSEVSIKGPEFKIIIKKSCINVTPLHLPSPVISNLSHHEDMEIPQEQLHIQIEDVKSSWVGIFHQGKEAVKVGDSIEVGQLLGSVKCMNLLFDINSPVNGTLLEILVKQDEIVEYGKLLFKISKDPVYSV